jgi:ketosteroid isomerase-like protein
MSEETVDVVRRWFDRLETGDPGVELCSPDIEIRNWSESPTPGPFHGHKGVRRWWRGVNDPDIGTDIQMFSLEEVIEVDEHRVVTVQRARGRGRSTGIEIDRPWGAVVTVGDGRVISAVGYATPDDAKQAAGLSE